MTRDDDPSTDELAPSRVLPLIRRFTTPEAEIACANDEAVMLRVSLLQEEHADLDASIRALESQAHHDRLQVARLKKKKLALKDLIQTLKDRLTPDIIA
jgi:hypothetical protein